MTWIGRLSVGCLLSWMVASAQIVQVPGQPFPEYGSYGALKMYAAQLGVGGSYLGVHLMEVNEDRAKELRMATPTGVEITRVAEESPAEAGGLSQGDVILEFRGEKVAGLEHFKRLVRETPVGREVPVVVWRAGSRQTLTVKVGKREAPQMTVLRKDCEGEDCVQPFGLTIPNLSVHVPMPQLAMKMRILGAELEGVNGQFADHFGVEEGVLVRSVDVDSPAGRAKLQAGDVIVSVEGETVRTPRQLHSAIRSAESTEVSIEVMRNHKKKTLAIERSQNEGPFQWHQKARPVQTRQL